MQLPFKMNVTRMRRLFKATCRYGFIVGKSTATNRTFLSARRNILGRSSSIIIKIIMISHNGNNGINEYALIYWPVLKWVTLTKWRQVYVDEFRPKYAVTTASGNEFQMCITLIEKKFERKLW